MKLNEGPLMKHIPIIAAIALLLAHLPAHAVVTCSNENTNVPASTPTAQFTLHADGTATDTATGLMWMRCSLGQTWDGSTCTGTATGYTWQAALQVTQEINSGTSNADNDNAAGFAGHTDWRLPNKNELASIVERRCWSPAINAAVFQNTPSSWFWSSSPNANNTGGAWDVGFNDGSVYWGGKGSGDRVRVRLVRAGQ